MQTLERDRNVKLYFNVPNEIGEKIKQEPDVDLFALKAFELIYFFLDKNGKTLDQITPELLGFGLGESLKEDLEDEVRLSKNHSINAFLQEIKKHGGITKETAEEIRKSRREFREDFTLEQLASIERGLADIEAGRIISQEKMTQNISHLRANFNKSKR